MKTFVLTLLSVQLLLATTHNYKVLDNNGQEVKTFSIELNKTQTEMISIMKDEVSGSYKKDVSDLNGSTQSFEWKGKNTDIKGTVEEGVLNYKGTFHGRKVDISIPLDEGIPFILNTRDSLTPFLYEKKQSKYLYVTSSSSLSAYKFKATKEKVVELKIDDKTYQALQIDFSMSGMVGFFMGSDKLYFDMKDGKFLKRIDHRNKRVELIDEDWD